MKALSPHEEGRPMAAGRRKCRLQHVDLRRTRRCRRRPWSPAAGPAGPLRKTPNSLRGRRWRSPCGTFPVVGDVVGRVVKTMSARPPARLPHRLGTAGIAADQPVGTHCPDIAGLRDRIGRAPAPRRGRTVPRRRAGCRPPDRSGQRQIEAEVPEVPVSAASIACPSRRSRRACCRRG